MPTTEELLAYARQRAALEIETWIPQDPGDNIAGTITEITFVPVQFDPNCPSTIFETEDGQTLRYNWMGAVPRAMFDRLQPQEGEILALHYQKNITPKTPGYEDYKYISIVVVDPATGRSKRPVDLSVQIPTEEQLANVNPETGEVPPLTPNGYEPFPDEVTEDDDTEISAKTDKKK